LEIVQKTIAAAAPSSDPLEFVMSDETVDRMGEVISADGWRLGNFKNHPIALFGHDSKFIIGHWRNVRVQGKRLLGQLELLPAVSDRLRELHAAVQAGIARAVSVGFHAFKMDGNRYIDQELVECSLVAVPANPNALQVAKSLNLSRETMTLIFGKTADEGQVTRREIPGKPPGNTRSHGRTPMNISERIEAAQERLVQLKDQLTDHLGKQDDDGVDEEAFNVVGEELNQRIASAQKNLDMLQTAEASLGMKSEATAGGNGAATGTQRRPFAVPKKEVKREDFVYRSLTAMLLSHVTRRPVVDVLREHYGNREDWEPTLKVAEGTVLRAATVPATTTLTGWAAELVQTSVADFLSTLSPMAVYPRLSGMGQRFTFGRNGIISVPAESATPTIAGGFVAEGAAIPVKQGAFTAVTLTPKKMGVISTFTRQIAEHSTPAIEQLIRSKMQRDTAVAIDTVLLDATAASTTRPAGLRNGVSALTATAGANFAALVADLKQLLGVLVAANSLRRPVFIMNPSDALSISLAENAGGDFPFKQEINGGMFGGYPVITSTVQTLHTVVLLDAEDFVSVTGDEPKFDVSDQATLHLEDTAPQAIGLSGSTTVPIRSLWQTDSIGLRMLLDINWAMLRTGTTTYVPSVTW
jgi:HK97 family phage major capsid protein/HK97 family phage prohead protease